MSLARQRSSDALATIHLGPPAAVAFSTDEKQVVRKVAILLASVTAASLLGFLLYCVANGITSVEAYRNFREMRADADQLADDLTYRRYRAGTPVGQLLSQYTPCRMEQYGGYVLYEFECNGYHSETVIAYNSSLVAAYTASCTYHWTYFDVVPETHRTAMARVSNLRRIVDKYPAGREEINRKLQQTLALLQ